MIFGVYEPSEKVTSLYTTWLLFLL